MHSAAFQLNKVRRLIKTHGRRFQFDRAGRNEFREPNGETVSHELRGVFHETQPIHSHIGVETSEGSSMRQRSSPLILALWEDAVDVLNKDLVRFNNKTYRVNGITNLLEANLVADISLEEVQS